MKTLCSALRLMLIVALALIPGYADAFSLLKYLPSEGSFALGEWGGEAATGYEYEDLGIQENGISNASTTRNRFSEEINLRNDGFYIVDPALVQGTAAGGVVFFQEDDKYSNGHGRWDGTLLNYDGALDFLTEKAVTATTMARRGDNDMSTEFGGRSHNVNQTFGLTARLREYSLLRKWLPFLSGRIDAREEQIDQTTSQLGQSYTLNETRDTVGFALDKGFQTGDLGIDYNYIIDRYAGSSHFAFNTQWAAVNYSLDFGPTLNRRFDSRISYYNLTGQTGQSGQSLLYVDELLHLDHYDNLFSQYEWVLTQNDIQDQSDLSNTGTFTVQYRLFRNLTNAVMVQGNYEKLTQGQRDFYAAEFTPTYDHAIPWGGTLFLSSDSRFQINDDNLTAGAIQVVHEQHSAPQFFGPGLGFVLNNPFVITPTIQIWDTGRGGLIPVLEGVDYQVVAQGSLTQIVILPTTIIIQPGDPLVVNYEYQVAPQSKYSTRTIMIDGGVAFGWANLDLQHMQMTQSLMSGQSNFLTDITQDSARIDVHKDWERFGLGGNALFQNYDSSSELFKVRYFLQSYSQYVMARPGWGVDVRLNGGQMLIDYSEPSRRMTSIDWGLSLDRYFGENMYFLGYGRVRFLNDTLMPSEKYYEAGLRGHFQYGKIHIEPMFTWMNRTWGPIVTNDYHLMLRIGRYIGQ